MKPLLHQFVSYNQWANARICEMLSLADDSQLNKELKSSYPTLIRTLLHIADAETLWLLRLQGQSLSFAPNKNFAGTFNDARNISSKASEDFLHFVKAQPEDFFEKNTTYQRISGEPFTNLNSDIILHCMNHSSYHRGQVITMLREVGVTNLKPTDYIIFRRD